MSNLGSSSSSAARDRAGGRVVRPLSAAAERACVRPGCPAPARASLVFRYASREAWLEPLGERSRPEAYDLCAEHAQRTQPPSGWELQDRRPPAEQEAPRAVEPPERPGGLGGAETVAVLAAALHPDDESSPPPPGDQAPGTVAGAGGEGEAAATDDPRPGDGVDPPGGVEAADDDAATEPSSLPAPLPASRHEGTSPALEPARGDAEARGPAVDASPPGGPAPRRPRPVLAARERAECEQLGLLVAPAARDW